MQLKHLRKTRHEERKMAIYINLTLTLYYRIKFELILRAPS